MSRVVEVLAASLAAATTLFGDSMFAVDLSTDAVPGHVAVTCEPLADMLDRLDAEHGRKTVFIGFDARGTVLELVVAADGTWTALMIGESGLACELGHGWFGILDPLRRWPGV